MKKFLLFILVLVIIAGVCFVTCPDKAAHCKALKDVLNTVLTKNCQAMKVMLIWLCSVQ